MSRKKQEIKIVLHAPKQMDIEKRAQIEEFWIEKMISMIKKANLSKQERQYLAERLNEKAELYRSI